MIDCALQRAGRDFLARRGYELGLDECVFKNPSQGDDVHAGPMADTMSAIIGAIFFDCEESICCTERAMDRLGISWPEEQVFYSFLFLFYFMTDQCKTY